MMTTLQLTRVGSFWTRDGTTDANAVYALANDEYGLFPYNFTGWAIDIGAHIGTVGLTLARMNPDLRVLAVEAVPDNFKLLERNVRESGLPEGQVIPVAGYATRTGEATGTIHYGYRHFDHDSDGYVEAHRFVGGTWRSHGDPEYSTEMPAVSLAGLIADHGIDEVAVLKIDCEGCEWAFLDTPAVARVRLIVGEYHGGYGDLPDYVPYPARRIEELLSATHDVAFTTEDPSVGLFRAVRRV